MFKPWQLIQNKETGVKYLVVGANPFYYEVVVVRTRNMLRSPGLVIGLIDTGQLKLLGNNFKWRAYAN